MDVKKIARERIDILFSEASKRPEKANRYVELARRIAMKARISLSNFKTCYCTKCHVLFNSESLKVRIKKGFVVYECLKCGFKRRYKK